MSDTRTAAESAAAAPAEYPAVVPWLGIAALYLLTILLGLAVTDEVAAAGLTAFPDPGSVGNVGIFAVEVVVFTAIIIAAQRLGFGMRLLRLFMLAVFGYMVAALVGVLAGVGTPAMVAVGLAVVAVLYVHPEWYVIDIVAVVAGGTLIPVMGLSFGPLPAVVLLVVWAGYDAYMVYVSGHMQEAIGGIGELKAPMLYVVPRRPGFSFRDMDGAFDIEGEEEGTEGADADDESDTDDPDEPEDSGVDAALLGLGDAVIPGLLAVSAGAFLDAPTIVPALNLNAPALGALLGGVVGLGGLLYVAQRVEGAHAGLPPLNAGVLVGYLLGALYAGVPLTNALGL